jgi:hypothetical protein
MCKALDKGMEITGIELMEKRGGKSGDYMRPSAPDGKTGRTRVKTRRKSGK